MEWNVRLGIHGRMEVQSERLHGWQGLVCECGDVKRGVSCGGRSCGRAATSQPHLPQEQQRWELDVRERAAAAAAAAQAAQLHQQPAGGPPRTSLGRRKKETKTYARRQACVKAHKPLTQCGAHAWPARHAPTPTPHVTAPLPTSQASAALAHDRTRRVTSQPSRHPAPRTRWGRTTSAAPSCPTMPPAREPAHRLSPPRQSSQPSPWRRLRGIGGEG
jgi:hypothetical protein